MKDLRSNWINELTWKEIDNYLEEGNETVLIPIGSTEQHGPGCPTGLDSYVAEVLAEDAAKRTDTLIAPLVWYGNSDHHMGFAGTISLRPKTLMALSKDICSSLIHHGFRNLLLINGHRGANLPALNLVVKELHEKHTEVLLAIADPFKISTSIARDLVESEYIFHASELEISHLMYKYPELIKRGKLKAEIPNFESKFSKFFAIGPFDVKDSIDIPLSAKDELELTKSGVMGDPTAASPEKGEEYHEAMVTNLVEFIEWMKQRNEHG